MGVKGVENLARGWIAPIERLKYFFAKFSFSDANDASPQLD
jgi:hypothetical protein